MKASQMSPTSVEIDEVETLYDGNACGEYCCNLSGGLALNV